MSPGAVTMDAIWSRVMGARSVTGRVLATSLARSAVVSVIHREMVLGSPPTSRGLGEAEQGPG
jgi:hypothetical protein